jgi:hypothetical protein
MKCAMLSIIIIPRCNVVKYRIYGREWRVEADSRVDDTEKCGGYLLVKKIELWYHTAVNNLKTENSA